MIIPIDADVVIETKWLELYGKSDFIALKRRDL